VLVDPVPQVLGWSLAFQVLQPVSDTSSAEAARRLPVRAQSGGTANAAREQMAIFHLLVLIL